LLDVPFGKFLTSDNICYGAKLPEWSRLKGEYNALNMAIYRREAGL